jgi:AcrR family transcriptional regulator
MAQIKKNEVMEAILAAAFDLFSRKGFSGTTMTEIARTANMTVANLYVYFDSKLVLFYAIYHPWLLEQLNELRGEVNKMRSPATKLRRIFTGIWYDLPAKDHAFSISMVQALAVVQPGTTRPSDLLVQAEQYIADMIKECLTPEQLKRFNPSILSHVIWMAFDGFVVNKLFGDTRDVDQISELMVTMILGEKLPVTRKSSK